jgi:PAS domain S-box-containing protein
MIPFPAHPPFSLLVSADGDLLRASRRGRAWLEELGAERAASVLRVCAAAVEDGRDAAERGLQAERVAARVAVERLGGDELVVHVTPTGRPGAAVGTGPQGAAEHQIAEAVSDGVVVATLDETIVYANRAAGEMVGYGPGELVGRRFEDFMPPHQLERSRAERSRRHRGGRTAFVMPLLARDGRERPILISTEPRLGASGEVDGIIVILRDLAERQRSEIDLLTSRRRLAMQNRVLAALIHAAAAHPAEPAVMLRQLVEWVADALRAATVSVWRLEENGARLRCAERFDRVSGRHDSGATLSREEVPDYFDALAQGNLVAVSSVAEDSRTSALARRAGGGPGALLDVPLLADGRWLGVLSVRHASTTRLWHPDEELFATAIAALVTHAYETAARHRRDEEIRVLARLPEEHPQPLLRFDPAGRLLYGNPASRQQLPDLTDGLPPILQELVAQAVERGQPVERQTALGRRTFWFLAAPVVPEGYVNLYGRDVTELTASIEQLVEAREQALEAARVKSEFLANMSHEIRTPLNAVIGMGELLLGTSLDATQRGYAQLIRSSGKTLLRLIGDILDYSRIEAGRLELERGEIVLPDVVDEVVQALAQEARRKQLALRTVRDIPARCVLAGDPARVQQILFNLLGNAIKFTEAGEVVVEAALARRGDGRDELVLTVTDTGVGIATERHEAIFEDFVQADGSTRRRFGGSGLGLAITARLVAAMGGRIELDSTPGRGSSFRVALPVEVLARGEESATPDSAAASGPVPPPRPLSILLAEDHPANRLLAVRLLERLGHRVRAVEDGRAAVQATQEERFDLVLMDVQMPELDGLDATRAIRAAESAHTPRLPIVALTAHAFEHDRQRCLAAGMDGYLTKPISSGTLEAMLARWGTPREPAPVQG